MDLDEIKKDWQQAVLKPMLNEENITQMISNEGKSAFNKIKRYELLGMIGMVFFYPLIVPLFRYLELQVFFIVMCILGFFWQAYKYRLLKKMDLLRMPVITISDFYVRYRKYILIEFWVGMVWYIIFVSCIGYLEYKHEPDFIDKKLGVFIVIYLFAFLFVLWLYRITYVKNMKKLRSSIDELRELEMLNQDELNKK